MARRKKKGASNVYVTFTDGEVQVYRISARPTIGTYLALEAGATGVLSLFNDEKSWGIPVASIREWSIEEVNEEEQEEEEEEEEEDDEPVIPFTPGRARR